PRPACARAIHMMSRSRRKRPTTASRRDIVTAPHSSLEPARRTLRVGAIEPYFGGSHAHFLRDLQRFSAHSIELFTLPARQWKWRVRGAALQLARDVNRAATESAGGFDAFLCSDFVNVPDFRALLAPHLRALPVPYYLHENQMTYPLSPDEEFDPYFGFTNILSCLSAEAVVFNSDFHRREFLERLPKFLPRLPNYDPRWVADTIAAKAEVLPLGLDVAALEQGQRGKASGDAPPRILWNHRWEFDKQPEMFFVALEALAGSGVPFPVAAIGESFGRGPPVFDTARARLGSRIGRFGFIESRADYLRCLWDADVVVSTARQEFFGIA